MLRTSHIEYEIYFIAINLMTNFKELLKIIFIIDQYKLIYNIESAKEKRHNSGLKEIMILSFHIGLSHL